jgi:sulfate permease, SulP family
MLFVITWRFPRSPGPLIAMILAGGCVALFDLASNGIHAIGAVPRGLPVPTLPSLTGIDIATFA